MENISVSRALVELKTLEKRIEKTLNDLQPVTVMIGTRLEAGISDREEFEKSVTSSYQSLMALVARKRKIKSAVVKSNAMTTVNVSGEIMTVAEAIERKNSIGIEKNIRKHLAAKYSENINKIENHNGQIHNQLLQLLKATYSKSETEISAEDYDKISKPFRENNEAKLLDPLEIEKKMRALEEKIDMFESEVDIALTESNARTEIKV
ncbi:MAG: hypothetical protein BWK80_32505 [Desulfobacteraceae bacterium IS3]|nr:MAG: hypothetical protein BWK80_32505 [Desulfobacteraceae bacterium IS3]